MTTYHIHINGQVQGVGFRPFVYKLAAGMGIHGWVSNTNDGVHIEFNGTPGIAAQFYRLLLESAPPHAIIINHHIQEVSSKLFRSFTIKDSMATSRPTMLLTPDIALCPQCRKDLTDAGNRRFRYPFTTCLHCGPRYSVITALPYDRPNTTMAPLPLCPDCLTEYHNVMERRHYCQTLSCPQCSITMHLYDAACDKLSNDNEEILASINSLLNEGNIVAVKGIGGYLLLCDASNEFAIMTLRQRKHRPGKPFALLYSDPEMAKHDVELHRLEAEALLNSAAPIVLCKLRPIQENHICSELLAPGLDKLGVMLPYSPLLYLLARTFNKPLVATSGNLSGAPIIYQDNVALESLNSIADYILTYDREIVLPQDDSVLQFTSAGQKIILRRSRGLAPNYYPNPFRFSNEVVLAMGGELKSAFALLDHVNLFVSQYLGNQESLESQTAFEGSVNHLLQVLQAKPARVLIDKHPGYFVSAMGREKSIEENIPITAIQHHKAHFGAVLAENNLLRGADAVLGAIWDGTGFGDDEQVWGGEFFTYEDGDMYRVAHLDYFPQLLGDKMSREPRLSALSLLKNFPAKQKIIEKHFTEQEWKYYEKELRKPGQLLTSSMGRLLDGLASILDICQLNSYEGEAAMKLEAIARTHRSSSFDAYPLPIISHRIDHGVMLSCILSDLAEGRDTSHIAWKIFCSLASLVANASDYFGIRKLAFSGGVFQNELLTELIIELLSQKNELYFHHQLSPNDECIGVGQIACYEMLKVAWRRNSDRKKETPKVQNH